MTDKYREEKRKRVARQSEEATLLADDPLADEIKSVIMEAVVEEETKEEEAEKYYDCYYLYYGGALSFAELDAYLETEAEVQHFESVTYQFKSIISNILSNSDVGTADKATMISSAAEVFKQKLSAREKGLFGKIKEYVSDLVKDKKELSKEESNGLEIITQKDGSKRWFGRYTNNYKDREQEIISEEAHKEFVAYLKEHPDRMPAFWSWHILGTSREKDADFIDYFDGFMVASGPLTAEEAAQLEKAIEYDDGKTGMSHGMYILERDPDRKEIITKYRTYEISDLPLANAANGFTSINSTKEVKMTDEKNSRLVATVGEDAAKKIMDQIAESKESLEALGVESKEGEVAKILDSVDPEKGKSEEAKPEESDPAEESEESKEINSSIKAIAVAVAKVLDMKGLSDLIEQQQKTIKTLEDQVGVLKKEDDEKIAETFIDKSLGSLVWKRASESEDTVLGEDEAEKIKSQKPTWVTEVMS